LAWPRTVLSVPARGPRGRIEDLLGRVEPIASGVVCLLGMLAGGVGFLQHGLRGGEPAAQLCQLPDRFAAFPSPVHHTTIIAGQESRRPTPGIDLPSPGVSHPGVACLQKGETADVVLIVDDLLGWLVGLLADAGRKKLVTLVLGTDQERALR